jgi:Flp pilus assembly protein TadD
VSPINIAVAHFLDIAARAVARGDVSTAIGAHRATVLSAPNDGDLAVKCGVRMYQAGDVLQTAKVLMRAIICNPASSDAQALLGMALARLGRNLSAKIAFVNALLLRPEISDIWFNIGELQGQQSEHRIGSISYRRAFISRPSNVSALAEHGIQEYLLGNHGRAAASLRDAIERDPSCVRAHLHMGLVLATTGRHGDAATSFRRSLAIEPRQVDTVANLALTLRKINRRTEASRMTRRGMIIDPAHARFWSTRSALELEEGRPESGARSALISMLLDPGHADGPGNLAQSRFLAAHISEATRFGHMAYLLAPDRPEVRFNLAMYRLGAGELEEGWKNYQARAAANGWPLPGGLPGERWRFDENPGGTVLVTAEQGLGDEILMGSCLADAIKVFEERGCERILLECDRRLIPLYQRSFPSINVFPRLVTRESAVTVPDYTEIVKQWNVDSHLSTGDLPELVRGGLSRFASVRSFFTADKTRSRRWRDCFRAEDPRPVIGLCWRSRRARANTENYYPSLSSLGPLLTLRRVRFVSLQYDAPEEDLKYFKETFGVSVAQAEGLDMMNDIDDIAALIDATDGVVSANTSVLHLAGALGKPVHMLDYAYAWYTLGTGGYPWYGDVRYHTRMPGSDWEPQVQAVAAALGVEFT